MTQEDSPMIVVRVAKGISDHFPIRLSEWALATILVNWGWILLRPSNPDIFSTYPLFEFLSRIASENVWGCACLIIGLLRFVALILNGTFHEFKFSPHIRSLTSTLSCFLWAQITLGTLNVPVPTGLAVYPVLLMVDMYNTWKSASEAGAYYRTKNNAPDS